MFTRFTDAKGRPARRRGTTVVSAAAHAALAWLVAVATVRANPEPPAAPEPLDIIYSTPAPVPARVERPRGTPRSPAATAPAAQRAQPAERGSEAPEVVLPELPPIADGVATALATAATRALGAGEPAPSVGDTRAEVPEDGVWDAARVEVAARARTGNPPPRYPSTLEQAGVGGQVVARFVVDSAGRVEPGSIEIRVSDDPLFTDAVRRALARARFEPARVGGRPVRQLVELPFVFAARR